MANDLNAFRKKKDYLICVDSDGCAIDAMNVKHTRCFGPCMVREWKLDSWSERILKLWNDINLYTMTRGVNRFKGLAMALQEIHAHYTPVADLDALLLWTDTSPELSNAALESALAESPALSLRKALSWSKAVNLAIQALPPTVRQPFPMVQEALAMAHEHADIAIVSSANRDAITEEWDLHGLLPHTDILLAQDTGSKAYCIAQLRKKGYAPHHILMCGDAPGDLAAAEENQVLFFPVLVRQERESWEEFLSVGCRRLLSGHYAGAYQEAKIAAFLTNLGASSRETERRSSSWLI